MNSTLRAPLIEDIQKRPEPYCDCQFKIESEDLWPLFDLNVRMSL